MKRLLCLLCLFTVWCTCLFSCTPVETDLIAMPQDRAAGWYTSAFEPQGLFFDSADEMITTIKTRNYEEYLHTPELSIHRACEDAAYTHMIDSIWANSGAVLYADEPETTYLLMPMTSNHSTMSKKSYPVRMISQFERELGKLRIQTTFVLKDALAIKEYNQKDGQFIKGTDQNGKECTYLFYEGVPTTVGSNSKTYYLVRDYGTYILEFSVVSVGQEQTAEQVIDLLNSVNIQRVDLWDEIKSY
ncbi:MAG: hypothetical protein IJ009_01640 [Clostridia bacterium]|nr:hypothetical protein [Clostridia bacterium]